MRISDWSSDVCSSYLWADSALLTSRAAAPCLFHEELLAHIPTRGAGRPCRAALRRLFPDSAGGADHPRHPVQRRGGAGDRHGLLDHLQRRRGPRSEEQTSELQSLMRNSYAVFCLKKKNQRNDFTVFCLTHIH